MWRVFLMYALFGSIFSVGKIGVAASQPYFLTGMRMFLAGGLLMGYYSWRHGKRVFFSKQDWVLLALVAFFNVFITNAFEFWGLQYMSAGKTCLIYSLSPFAAAFIAYFFGTEKVSFKKCLGLGIGILSFCPLMLIPWLDGGQDVPSMELWAEGALTISAITAVIGWTFVKKLTVERKMPHSIVNGVSFLLAGGMCLATSLAIETWDPLPVFAWTDFAISLFYIVVIHNLICYSIYASALQRFSVTFMAFAGLSNPIFAAFFGWLFLAESITAAFWLAFAGVLVGLFLFYQEEQRAIAINQV
ncbi:DMT family transporter [Candidatus Protochlamydia phocaeensis]|uniref:DMT family transporter n=1 Tax=Candidatus Protochlamydia phocaeensis TaxID=1414722 RepID=UPI0009AC2CE2|nr:DMT family transporter [Candidatus Protochlamydia phocaeensis]